MPSYLGAHLFVEFLIADLALASHSIPSFTLSALTLLAPVLDSHPPSAIVTDAHFLPHLLELIHDSNESVHHTVIVVGETQLTQRHVLGQLRLYNFSEVEGNGAKQVPVPVNPPSKHQGTSKPFSQLM